MGWLLTVPTHYYQLLLYKLNLLNMFGVHYYKETWERPLPTYIIYCRSLVPMNSITDVKSKECLNSTIEEILSYYYSLHFLIIIIIIISEFSSRICSLAILCSPLYPNLYDPSIWNMIKNIYMKKFI
jgi:hypothetical protein